MKKKFFILTTVSNSLNFFRNQISELENYYNITLISSPSEQLKVIAEREKVDYKGIKMSREISLFRDFYSFSKLVFFFMKSKPYTIHCNTPKASLLGLCAGFLTNVPSRVYYIHGFRYDGTKGFKRKLLLTMEKISCYFATHIIAVSYGVKKIAEEELTRKPVFIIHNGSANGIDLQEFLNVDYDIKSFKKELDIAQEDFVYGFVGRLVGDKGINELVQAFDELYVKYPNTKLLLVGRYEEHLDPLEKKTLDIIKNHPSIIEAGYQTDVKKYLSVMNLFVSPSYREGFGLSLLEANLIGVPVLATKITGYSEIVIEGSNGFLINPKDSRTLLSKMEEIYHNKEILEQMRDSCREVVVSRYNHHDVKEQAIKFYNSFN